MALCLEEIEKSVSMMDDAYDANFGEWIRNEDNCKIVGANLKRYIDKYRASEFIVVVKWIVKDWTLKSIILFSKKLVVDDIFSHAPEEHARRVQIVSGFIYTWNPIFVAEFLLAVTMQMDTRQRVDLVSRLLNAFEPRKLSEILAQIEGKTDQETKELLVKEFASTIYKQTSTKWERTNSLVNAFNLI
ncbi:hypothetical protein PAPHI01_1034 [Pancytospora philotis]|nr:hypothetical protein PAPHI01_1034 [Pancytospora philotis]